LLARIRAAVLLQPGVLRATGRPVVTKDIDLRSDTVTRPSAAMREAMLRAELGDDVYEEDPTILALQDKVAALLGKQAALFVPSGTMSNQIALLCHCQRGDDVIAGEGTHCMLYESGAASAWAGVGFCVVGQGGLFGATDVLSAIKPSEYHFARSRLVVVENTHNRSGGRVFPQADVLAIAEAARSKGLAVHLDGARLWNASIATGLAPALLAAPADSVSVCFSKGLGAPVGSALCGSRDLITRARRFRKMLGGGMRQAGVLAAAASYALDHHVVRLAEDHAHARRLAAGLAKLPGVVCDPASVQTNIVVAELPGREAHAFVAHAREHGVRLGALGPQQLRAVTHLDVNATDIDEACARLQRALA
jgi:threonine aldolase